MSAGGIGTAVFAFAIGAPHALTPGHGKMALATYFLARKLPRHPSVPAVLIGWLGRHRDYAARD